MSAVDQDYAAVADAVRRGQRPTAMNLAARALKRGSSHPLILVLAAEGLEQRGEDQKALGLLRTATRAAPKNRVAWMRLAPLLARLHIFEEAKHAFDQAVAIEPNSFPALMGAGEMRLMLRDYDGAEVFYRRAADAAPREAAPLAVLAVMAAQKRNVGEARDLATRAAAITPGILGSEMALARADLMDREPALAEERLTRLLARSGVDDENRAGMFDVRAEALDALGRADEAFADYQARNDIALKVHGRTFAGPTARPPARKAAGMAKFLEATSSADWAEPPGDDAIGREAVRRHVFLIGFPRSGTTLLEKALGGHPDVLALEEVNHLAAAGADIREEAGWPRLKALSQAEADTCRETYWRLVRESLGSDISGKIVIDKLPLHTLELPVIARLFPEARILFAIRDPRDVVLSCFRRRFAVNAAMYEFLTLEGAARFYDATMTLAAEARIKLPLRMHNVRHESVIENFDDEMAAILSFMGAEWDPAVRNFSDRVSGHMKTPSWAQLSRGLNSDGMGQWRRYQRHMEPVLPVLAPWVERFGYS